MKYKLGAIYQNNHIEIIHRACKCCYNGTPETKISGMLKYIENKVKDKHESVLEHSNIVMYIFSPYSNKKDTIRVYKEYAEIISASRHLNCNIVNNVVAKDVEILIGGSIRAYKNIFRNLKTPIRDNKLAVMILETLQSNVNSAYFADLIEAGIMDFNKDMTPDVLSMISDEEMADEDTPKDVIDISNLDRGMHIVAYDSMDEIDKFLRLCNSLDDMMDMITVTVYIKDMSRIISQMVTRHRNAISQQSQRWVDESKAVSNNPEDFCDYLEKDKVYNTSFGELTMAELLDKMNSIYYELRDQGVHKEDARMFLTQSVRTNLYVTFTLRNLLHFLALRLDKHAQNEIRIYSEKLYETILEIYGIHFIGDLFKYTLPRYITTEVPYIDDEGNEKLTLDNINDPFSDIDEIVE